MSGLTSPWALAFELAMLGALVLLARVDWRRVAERMARGGKAVGPSGPTGT